MVDYAIVHCYGRAVANARLYNIGDEDKTSRAVFDLAINLPVRRDGRLENKAIFRRVVAWGYHADYIAKCQEDDNIGLKGRPVVITGNMDTENHTGDYIIRVGPPQGVINIIDRRQRDDG